jgi:hypothetical protein
MANRDIELQLGRIAAVLDLRVETVVKKVAFDLEADFKKRSPVDTGVFRASWNTSADEPNDTIANAGKKGTTIPSPGPSGPAALTGVDVKSQQIYITNAVEYAQYLEGGSSKQAPAGIVLVGVEAMKVEIDLVIAQAAQDNPL